jgi:hypothetical protein
MAEHCRETGVRVMLDLGADLLLAAASRRAAYGRRHRAAGGAHRLRRAHRRPDHLPRHALRDFDPKPVAEAGKLATELVELLVADTAPGASISAVRAPCPCREARR